MLFCPGIVGEIEGTSGLRMDFIDIIRDDPDKLRATFQLLGLLQEYYNKCLELVDWLRWRSTHGTTSVLGFSSSSGNSSSSSSGSPSPRSPLKITSPSKDDSNFAMNSSNGTKSSPVSAQQYREEEAASRPVSMQHQQRSKLYYINLIPHLLSLIPHLLSLIPHPSSLIQLICWWCNLFHLSR